MDSMQLIVDAVKYFNTKSLFLRGRGPMVKIWARNSDPHGTVEDFVKNLPLEHSRIWVEKHFGPKIKSKAMGLN